MEIDSMTEPKRAEELFKNRKENIRDAVAKSSEEVRLQAMRDQIAKQKSARLQRDAKVPARKANND